MDDSDRSGSDEPNRILRPGDPGFIPRARVPAPSCKDYVVRPKSNVESSEIAEKKVKKSVSRLDKHQRRFLEIKKVSKFQQAVSMNVTGKF
jgi:transcription factor SPN1